MNDIYVLLSWVGIAFLTLAHILVSCSASKSVASVTSAIGAAISLCAAAGLGIWPVVALNVAWAAISIWGRLIIERSSPSPRNEITAIFITCILALFWLVNAQVVAWVCSAAYVIGWSCFSIGAIRREIYLTICIIAGIIIVPSLWLLNAHAFAVNETIGVFIGAYGVLSIVHLRHKKSKVSTAQTTRAAPTDATPL